MELTFLLNNFIGQELQSFIDQLLNDSSLLDLKTPEKINAATGPSSSSISHSTSTATSETAESA